ncbi:MAG: ATP-grasp domain-containing protein, partial [Thermoleophilaceae bacterium]
PTPAAARDVPGILVEDFIPGVEVAVEGLLRAGELEVLAVFDKPDPLDGPFFEETLFVTPSRLAPNRRREVEAAVARATRALGPREGPIHAEVRLNDEGAWILEVAARSIGGLCARTLRFGAGVRLESLSFATPPASSCLPTTASGPHRASSCSRSGTSALLTKVARTRHRHGAGVSVVSLCALIVIATQSAGPAVWRPGLLAEACRRFGLALGRQLG